MFQRLRRRQQIARQPQNNRQVLAVILDSGAGPIYRTTQARGNGRARGVQSTLAVRTRRRPGGTG
eukprot:7495437-Pyramimonas_sp.AAC.1